MNTNKQNTKNNKTRKQQEMASQQAASAATLPDVVKVQGQRWAPGSAQSVSGPNSGQNSKRSNWNGC